MNWPPEAAVIDRFMDKVSPEPNTGCWIWHAAVDKDGYGKLKVAGKTVKAHRFSLALKLGRVPALLCLHSCDATFCVNPAHLSEGTISENTRQAVSRGLIPHAKMTDEMVRTIRSEYAAGVSIKMLMGMLHLPRSCVSKVVRNVAWRHVAP